MAICETERCVWRPKNSPFHSFLSSHSASMEITAIRPANVTGPDKIVGSVDHASQLAVSGGNARLIFNDRLDAVVTAALMIMVALVLLVSAVEWVRVLSGRKAATVKEAPFVTSRFVEERA